jgi:hypothetical protein
MGVDGLMQVFLGILLGLFPKAVGAVTRHWWTWSPGEDANSANEEKHCRAYPVRQPHAAGI